MGYSALSVGSILVFAAVAQLSSCGTDAGGSRGEVAIPDPADTPTQHEAVDGQPRPRSQKQLMEQAFWALDEGGSWSRDTERRLAAQISASAIELDTAFEIDALECCGDSVCRLELSHRSQKTASKAVRQILGKQLFSWTGRMVSFGLSETRQELFLLRNGYRFDGRTIAKTDLSATTVRARSGGGDV